MQQLCVPTQALCASVRQGRAELINALCTTLQRSNSTNHNFRHLLCLLRVVEIQFQFIINLWTNLVSVMEKLWWNCGEPHLCPRDQDHT